MIEKEETVAYNCTIKGLVQGVGFRPFIFKLAHKINIHGWVLNTNQSVKLHIEGTQENITLFIEEIKNKKPVASRIESLTLEIAKFQNIQLFEIRDSKDSSVNITDVSPDIAVCNECLHDMQHDIQRHNYMLVNCCNCGPRYSIIQSLPYDRKNTTMHDFEMCEKCAIEYANPMNRRFHAQPVSCNNCGPKYSLHTLNNTIINSNEILEFVKVKLELGHVFAFKGTGGFHLACNALDENAVIKLRNIKQRDSKPFAVMFRNMDAIQKYCHVSEFERFELESFRRPIVILKEKESLAPSVSMKMETLGVMLPYMPFHYALFSKIDLDVIVLTSCNLTDEPIIIKNEKAIDAFLDLTDGIVTYNREIYNRTDDSVLLVAYNKPRIIRRSRGFVPEPILLSVYTEGIFAAGAELTGTFCIGKESKAIASQYLGDLQNFENYEFYIETAQRLSKLFRFHPQIAVHDLHPDYVSTKFAKELSPNTLEVQHHFAHIASVMAEHELNERVLGVAFDGTGYGTDGNIWGSEFMICTPTDFERYTHFEYIPLPGGDRVVLEPWRSAVAYLYHFFGKDFTRLNIPFTNQLNQNKTELLINAIGRKINSPLSSSCGRLFDAVAAITGICISPSFHAEAPMRLEASISYPSTEMYEFEYSNSFISLKKMWIELVDDIKNKKPSTEISVKFHNTVVQIIIDSCNRMRSKTGINKVALSGGSFQNKYLIEKTENLLNVNKFEVFSNNAFPTNDGGIALGQMYIAANKRKNLT
jgi:hydrogenase maturation protein HypF